MGSSSATQQSRCLPDTVRPNGTRRSGLPRSISRPAQCCLVHAGFLLSFASGLAAITRRTLRCTFILRAVILACDSVHWQSFLARSPFPSPSKRSVDSLIEQSILITGAGGSIGSALALRLAVHGARLILLESSETALHELQQAFADRGTDDCAAFYLGSAGDGIQRDNTV